MSEPKWTPAQRAARLQRDDLSDMDIRITRREEWMAVQTMINNSCTMQSYIDDKTEGEKLYVQFYDTTSDHAYTVSTKWNATDEKGAAFFSDVKNMCRKLSKRGLRAADLVIGSDVADAILALTDVKSLLDRNSGIIIGTIDQQLSPYDGVTYMGTLNFGGFRLNVICVDETYVDDSGAEQRYFPATSAMVTAPDCGHMMYGQITQIDYGSTRSLSSISPTIDASCAWLPVRWLRRKTTARTSTRQTSWPDRRVKGVWHEN